MAHRLWQSGHVLLLLITALVALRAEALELGDLVVHSLPGQPLKASIPFSLQDDESMAQLRVVPASAEVYAHQRLPRPALLEGLQVALLDRGGNRGRIQLFGQQPWQGEEVTLLLQLAWPQGQMSRRFRIAPLAPEKAAERPPLYVEVGENESLDAVAIRLGKYNNRSYRHMMVALYRANPEAFYGDNINNLKGGVRLRVPSNEELYRLSDAEVTATLREHDERWQANRERRARARAEAERLQRQLQEVVQENETIEQRNRELRERLARLERQMSSISRQVREQVPAQGADGEPQPAAAQAPAAPAAEKRPAQDAPGGTLSVFWMLLLMLLAALAVFALWRYAPRLGQRGR